MATATRTSTVTLELSADEAAALADLLHRHVCGNGIGHGTPLNNVNDALERSFPNCRVPVVFRRGGSHRGEPIGTQAVYLDHI